MFPAFHPDYTGNFFDNIYVQYIKPFVYKKRIVLNNLMIENEWHFVIYNKINWVQI